MRKIEWKPIALGIGVSLALNAVIIFFITIVYTFKAAELFLFGASQPSFMFIAGLIYAGPSFLIYPIPFLVTLTIGSFVVGRYSGKNTLLQSFSVGIFYFILTWFCTLFMYYSNPSSTDPIVFNIKFFDIFLFLGLSCLFFFIGRKIGGKSRLPEIMEDQVSL